MRLKKNIGKTRFFFSEVLHATGWSDDAMRPRRLRAAALTG
ncbi:MULTISPECIES: hypothetical protein [unclassified Pseudoxanthomonas]|jgi:hypothetical protein